MLCCHRPLGLMMRPADQIVRELPPSLSAYWLRFPSAPPRLGCLLTCGVRLLNHIQMMAGVNLPLLLANEIPCNGEDWRFYSFL
jgi:hypothetical protein